jgi:hypothetical protein
MEASGVTLSRTTEVGGMDADEPGKLAALLFVLTPFAVAAWIGVGFLVYGAYAAA